MLRKTLIVSLMVIHLAGNTELGQLLKLPVLIAHFHQHRQQDPAVNFLDFLVMHYAGDDGTRADDATDQQLPCSNLQHNTFTVSLTPMVNEIPTIACCRFPAKEYSIHLQNGAGSKHVFLHLQPPRLG